MSDLKRKRDGEETKNVNEFLNSKNFTPEQLKQLRMMPSLEKQNQHPVEKEPVKKAKETQKSGAPDAKKLKPNKLFLKNLLKNTVDFNQKKINNDLNKSKKVLEKFDEKVQGIPTEESPSKKQKTSKEEAVSLLDSLIGRKEEEDVNKK
eukprot:gene5263-8881_t